MTIDQPNRDTVDRWNSDTNEMEPNEAPSVEYRPPSTDPVESSPQTVEDLAQSSTPARRKPTAKPEPVSSREDFTGPAAPLQVKIPTDLIQSLKLHAIASGKTMSVLVLDCLTSPEFLQKAWISTRRAA